MVIDSVNLHLRVVDTEAGFLALESAWRKLEPAGALTPFQTFHWNFGWWRLIGTQEQEQVMRLHIVVVEEGDEIIGLLPLAETGLTACGLSAPFADYLDVLTTGKPEHRTSVYECLFAYLQRNLRERWKSVRLDELPADSPFAAFLRARTDAGLRVEEGSLCPVLELADPDELARCLAIREYRRKERRLSKIGRLECFHHREPKLIADRLNDYMDMHLRQWLPRPNRGITFNREPIVRFYRGLADELAPARLVQLSELRLDGRAIAYYFGFVYAQTFWGYRPAFELNWKRFSPGHVLHRYLFRDGAAQGWQRFDFMRGDYEYKRTYATRLKRNLCASLDHTSQP